MPTSPTLTKPKIIQDGIDSFRLILPRRALGQYHWVGLVPLILGLGIGGFSYDWVRGALHGVSLSDHTAGLVFSLVFGLVGLPGLLFGLGLVLLGLAILENRTYSEIAVNRSYVRIVEHFFFLRWSWKKPAADLLRVSVKTSRRPGNSFGMGCITLAMEGCGSLLLGAGYPASLLNPTSETLAHLLSQAQIADHFDSTVRNDEDEDESDEEDESLCETEEARREKQDAIPTSEPADNDVAMPEGTKIVFTKDGNTCAFAIPATGLFRGLALGLLGFSTLWLCFVGFMMTIAMRERESIGILLFLGIFLSIGLALLALAVKIGMRRVLIAVTPELLAYQVTSPFGITKEQFNRAEVTTIGVGPSGTTVNNRPIPELKIGRSQDKATGLLEGVKIEELQWIAATLRSSLNVGKNC